MCSMLPGAKGYRHGPNLALWSGHLGKLLPSRAKREQRHHAALPYAKVLQFLFEVRKRNAVAALAIEFTVLTAARTGEHLGATWAEIDLENAVWTIPGARMKTGRTHRVPLSLRAVAILKQVQKIRTGDFVFPGRKEGRLLSNMSIEMILRRMKVQNATMHGFRSSFRDWGGNETDFARELAEAVLAHVVGDAVEQAYRRGDALERRHFLMEAWSGVSIR